MKAASHFFVLVVLILALLSSAMPCGPGWISPLFDTTSAPENPYVEFAAGKLGILKPTFRRSVLLAAYRYLNGGGLNAAEQKAFIDVWNADIKNKDFRDDSVEAAVKTWVDKRKEVVDKEQKIPEIYVERSYGGYDFFPNCTRSAFETATDTLADRISSNGPSDVSVTNWVAAQDAVFTNCASGATQPDNAPVGAPEWLQKDRAYQIAAADFYSTNYTEAKRRFAEIAQDSASPWQETADYLVARTLIRQASMQSTAELAAPFYEEAEAHLQRFTSPSGKFTSSAAGLMNLVRYRLHPKERVSELAKILSLQGGGDDFRQYVIDYTWLLDKFESEILTEKAKRDAEAAKSTAAKSTNTMSATNAASTAANGASNTQLTEAERLALESATAAVANAAATAANAVVSSEDHYNQVQSGQLIEVWIQVSRDASNANAVSSRTFSFPFSTPIESMVSEIESKIGRSLTDKEKDQIRVEKEGSYQRRTTYRPISAYEGAYYGDDDLSPSMLPDYLRNDDVTNWLFTFQLKGAEAYLYSLKQYRSTGSEVWLMTALSQADKTSAELPSLLEAANNASRTSPGYTTIAYHQARILLDQGRSDEARKIIDPMLNAGDELPISARNSFVDMKLQLAETLDDFLKYSLKRAFAFDFSGDAGTVDEIIAEQKAWYDPNNDQGSREDYETQIENNYKNEKLWQSRLMFDSDTIEIFNQQFPTKSLIDVYNSAALPEYMRERFAMAIWTRAYLLGDDPTVFKFAPEVAKYHPEMRALLLTAMNAKPAAARADALLYFVIKNPILTPYIQDGTGRDDNEAGQWDIDNWWCAPYDTEYDEATGAEVPRALPRRPAFLTALQGKTARTERSRLTAIGDAPKYLGQRTLAWAKRLPEDKRVPEALYMMATANGWTKYSCGNNEELQTQLSDQLKKRYPNSEWTKKLIADAEGQ